MTKKFIIIILSKKNVEKKRDWSMRIHQTIILFLVFSFFFSFYFLCESYQIITSVNITKKKKKKYALQLKLWLEVKNSCILILITLKKNHQARSMQTAFA